MYRHARLTAALLLCGAVVVGAAALVHYAVPAGAQDAGKEPVAPVVGEGKKAPEADMLRDREAKRALREEAAARMKERMQDPALRQRMQALRGMAGPPAIAVAGDAVYVVKGNTIYKFSTDDLSLIAKSQLEELPEMPMVLKAPKARPAPEAE